MEYCALSRSAMQYVSQTLVYAQRLNPSSRTQRVVFSAVMQWQMVLQTPLFNITLSTLDTFFKLHRRPPELWEGVGKVV